MVPWPGRWEFLCERDVYATVLGWGLRCGLAERGDACREGQVGRM